MNQPLPRFRPLLLLAFFLPALAAGMASAQSVMPAASGQLIPLHVAKGTNLIHIARNYCTSRDAWHEIARINGLKPPYLILADSELQVPLDLLRSEQVRAVAATVHGKALVKSPDTDPVPLADGAELLPGQTVITDQDGHVQIILPNQRFTRIGPDSTVQLNYLIRLEDGAMKTEFFLSRGRIAHAIALPLNVNDTFRTASPMVLTGVRGTAYRLKLAGEEGAVIETLHGSVQAQAGSTRVLIGQGKGIRVADNGRLGQPRPLPPKPDSPVMPPIFKALPLTITLPQAPDIDTLRLRLSNDREGLDTFFEASGRPGSGLVVSNLPDGAYWLHLTGEDGQGFESEATGPLPLAIRTVPAAPITSEPRDGFHAWQPSIDLTWLASASASAYSWEIAEDPTFSRQVANGTTASTTLASPALEPGRYWFRVAAVAADGFSSNFAEPISWTVHQQVDLGELAAEGEEGLNLAWPSAGDGFRYDLQISPDQSFTRLLIDARLLEQSSFSFPSKPAPGTYQVRVRVVLADGTASPWTPPQQLKVAADPLGFGHLITALIILVCTLL